MKNTIRLHTMNRRNGVHGSKFMAIALALGFVSVLLSEDRIGGIQAAFAEPVIVEPVPMADFSGVVKAVSPAVVSVKTRTEVKVSESENNFFEGIPGFGLSPDGFPNFNFKPNSLTKNGLESEEFVESEEFSSIVEELPGFEVLPGQIPGNLNSQSGIYQFGDLPVNHPLVKEFDILGQRDGLTPGIKQWSLTKGLGSGFLISEDGFIVTNEHVVRNAKEIKVVTDSGETYEAELIGADERTDLALLKVDVDRKFTYVKFADTIPEVGQWVVAVGNPFGLGGTVTAGIVSARGRDIGAGPYDDFIQIDAPVNSGNSGGPAFNLKGEVVGVNAAIYSPDGGNVGIAFAIPSNVAEDIVNDLMDDGTVVRGWLGVSIQRISEDIADSLGLKSVNGALISEPLPDSPALEAGLKAGDAILAVNRRNIEEPRDLARLIASYPPGTAVELTLWRENGEETVVLELGQLPDDPANQDRIDDPTGRIELSRFGLELESSDAADEGVVIKSISPGSIADRKNLRKGTIILEIAGDRVKTPAEVASRIHEAREEGRKAVLLRLKMGNSTRFVALPIEMT